MQQIDPQRCAARLAGHVGGPLRLVQQAIVARRQPIFAHLLDVVLLRDDLRIRAGEDLRAMDVVAVVVGIDDVADWQRGDFAELIECGARRSAGPSVVSTTTTLRSVKTKMTLPSA